MSFRISRVLRQVAGAASRRVHASPAPLQSELRPKSVPTPVAPQPEAGQQVYWDAVKKQTNYLTLFTTGIALASVITLVTGYQFSLLIEELKVHKVATAMAIKRLDDEIHEIQHKLAEKH